MRIEEEIKEARTVGISGHIRPDGDCVGACTALYGYLKRVCPDKEVELFLEKPSEVFDCLEGIKDIRTGFQTQIKRFDVFFALDTVKERMGEAEKLFDQAGRTINIDHHISNPGCGDVNVIDAGASSTCELVYDVLSKEKLDKDTAKSLYVGIIHDTGVLKYSNTTPKTLRTAAELISFGFDFSQLIEKTFYEKTYVQTLLLGRALLESILFMDGKCIVSGIEQKTLDFYHADSGDLEGIVSQLNQTEGVECTIFMYQTGVMEHKVSLRSKGKVDVAEIAMYFGGGGHVRAAGCTMNGSFYDVINNLSTHIMEQLRSREKEPEVTEMAECITE